MLVLMFVTTLLPPVVALDSISTPWLTTGWQSSTPEEQGVDSQALADMVSANKNVHSILVIRHGQVILDASSFPFTSSLPHAFFSVTKSFVSTLVGIAFDKGYIKSVNQSMLKVKWGQASISLQVKHKASKLADFDIEDG